MTARPNIEMVSKGQESDGSLNKLKQLRDILQRFDEDAPS